ncbi:MAG: glycosyltransferase family 2 protein [Candidatus Gastranaerophilales bacterium]|nr:glycosyltransferase family 2 protein [Candidatus Gastranaerophilales bacterium]
MKLIIQIPAYNEEISLPLTLSSIKREYEGIDEVELLVINDGSTDRTRYIAEEYGVEHILNLKFNMGLAKAFLLGLQYCINAGADIIVNIDADNQYNADDIGKLIWPIVNNRADIAIGTRPVDRIKQFSPLKKVLQKFGSKVVRLLSSTGTEDAASGFRAFSRKAAMMMNVFDNYTYTMETIMQSKSKGLTIESVPVRTNAGFRKSKLVRSMFGYVKNSGMTILRMFIIYRPFRFFAIIGGLLFIAGALIWLRFLWFYIHGNGSGNIQSLIFSTILIVIGFQTAILGVIADLLGINRKLIEDVQIRVKQLEQKNNP